MKVRWFAAGVILLVAGVCMVGSLMWMTSEFHFNYEDGVAAADAPILRHTLMRWVGAFCILLGIWLMDRSLAGGGVRWLRWTVMLGVLGLLAIWGLQHPITFIYEQPLTFKGMSNARQIEIALATYASDHDGKYPDAALSHSANSNEVLCQLFVGGYLSDERVFGCPLSGHKPDGVIGREPNFAEALKAGENHWAMTKGLTVSSPPNMPLIFESPAVASWPPKWNADAVETAQPGRVWKGAKVIVGINDGSVSLLPLEGSKGSAVGLAPREDGSPVFPDVHPTPEILDIEK